MKIFPDEWDPIRAKRRSLPTMERIAKDALEFADGPGPAYDDYAIKHHLNINEIVYYLNAYESSSVYGLEAIRNPDIIPPDYARQKVKVVTRSLESKISCIPLRITDEGTAIGVYQINQIRDGQHDRIRRVVAEFLDQQDFMH
ncbi:hypothetical protein ACFLZW_05985 [Chloroflexota bacterium]